MAGERVPGPLKRPPSFVIAPSALPAGGFESRGPVGLDSAEPTRLDNTRRVSKVTKDWSDPPSVTPTLTPEISGATLKDVLVELQKLTEWGTGGGNLSGNGPGGEIQAEPSGDGKSYTIALKGDFFVTLAKWKEYATATDAQKSSWDAMIANLRQHEEEHVAIAYRGAEKLIRELTGLDVRLAAQKIANAQTTNQNDQDDFDSPSKTDHCKNDWGRFKRVNLDTSVDPPPKPKP